MLSMSIAEERIYFRHAVSESADRDKTAIWIEKWLSDKKIQYRPKPNKNSTDQKISVRTKNNNVIYTFA